MKKLKHIYIDRKGRIIALAAALDAVDVFVATNNTGSILFVLKN
jgi:hypothetical protein